MIYMIELVKGSIEQGFLEPHPTSSDIFNHEFWMKQIHNIIILMELIDDELIKELRKWTNTKQTKIY